jgi:hypothetical protein
VDHDESLKLLYAIQTEYGEDKFPITDERAQLWSMALDHMDFNSAMAAFVAYLRNGSPFPPKPGDLLNQVATAATDQVLTDAAWEEVLREVSRVGLNPMPYWAGGVHHPAPKRTFSSPLIEAAVEAVGWREICTTDKLSVLQFAFRDALRALMGRHQRNIRTHGVEEAITMLQEGRKRPAGMVSAGEIINGLESGAGNPGRSAGNHDRPARDADPEGRLAGRHEPLDSDRPNLGISRHRHDDGFVRIQKQREALRGDERGE